MNDERFISGIFNYCDYWCERCLFTRRCRNYVMGRELEREARGEEPVDDATRAGFWDQLADQLRETTVFGRAGDWEDGVGDDFDYELDPEFEAREQEHRRAVKEHPLTTLAHTYMKKAHKWLESSDADLKLVAKELLDSAGHLFNDADYEEEARRIGEMIEVIAWYHTLLPPKIGRAVSSMLEREEHEDPEMARILAESHQYDANGSGKLALVSIQRSAGAWVEMRKHLPHREDEIIEMLAILSRLQRGLLQAIPGAKSFVRPGLDAGDGPRL